MSQPYLGEMRMFSFGFAPRGWAFCNGQLLSIAQNQALFSILGTTYGGNGQTTFALPDLRSRTPIHFGNSPNGNFNLGEVGGQENHTLIITEMPTHNHLLSVTSANAATGDPADNLYANSAYNLYANSAPNALLDATVLNVAGSTQPHANLQPYLTINICIAISGIFPSRN